jgi:hypothetical protein
VAQGIPDYIAEIKSIYKGETDQLILSNTTSETTIFSCVIKGGYLSSHEFFKGRINYSYLNNTGSNRTWRIRFKLGSTTMYNDTTGPMGSGLGARAGWIDFTLSIQGSNQFIGGLIEQSYRNTSTTGVGDLQITAGHTETSFTGIASEIISGDLTFAITVEMSYASTSHTWTREFAYIDHA